MKPHCMVWVYRKHNIFLRRDVISNIISSLQEVLGTCASDAVMEHSPFYVSVINKP